MAKKELDINSIKIIMRRIIEGDLDDEIRDLHNYQEYEYGVYIPINSKLAKQVNEIMGERGLSLQDFILMSFVKISQEEERTDSVS